jgi:hypothetical protein
VLEELLMNLRIAVAFELEDDTSVFVRSRTSLTPEDLFDQFSDA